MVASEASTAAAIFVTAPEFSTCKPLTAPSQSEKVSGRRSLLAMADDFGQERFWHGGMRAESGRIFNAGKIYCNAF